MPEQTNTPEPVQEADSTAPVASEAPTEDPPTPTPDERRDGRTRAKLREVEGERDRLRGALVPHVRTAVEAAVGGRLDSAMSLWLLPDLDPLALVDAESFAVDQERVDAAVDRLLAHAPQLGRRFGGSGDGGARFASTATTNPWAQVIKPS